MNKIISGLVIFIGLFFIGLANMSGYCQNKKSLIYEQESDGLLVHLQPGTLKLQVCQENIIRVFYSPDESLPTRKSLMIQKESWPIVDWDVKETADEVTLVTRRLDVRVNRVTGAVAFYNPTNQLLLKEPEIGGKVFTSASVMGEDVWHIKQQFVLTENEALYGLGQHQDGFMNYRSHDVLLVQTNTNASVPFLVSTNGYGILWDNYSQTKFHDGTDGTFLWSEVADVIDYYFIAGSQLDDVIAGYRTMTGKAPLFGKWAYGYWQCKERYNTQDEIIGVVKEYRKRQIPLDNIVQDWMYWGDLGWSAMDFDRKKFPDPTEMIKTIHGLNVHYMISIWPRFDPKSAIYKEMDSHGHVFHTDGEQEGYVYDAFSEKARDIYWYYVNKGLFSRGVDAWWMDATEPEFGDVKEEVSDKAKKYGYTAMGSWARYLNAYSLMSTKGVYEAQRNATSDKRVFILTRSAYAGQQRYAGVTWSGDIVATWDVFRKQISAGLNFCMTGIPYWTTDIGAFIPNNPLGCKDEAYRELYVRWFQFGALCPIFRSHGTGTPREVWQFGEPGTWAYDTLVKYDVLRYRLFPYIYSLAWKVTNEDYTLMRGLAFDFKEDQNILDIDDQYMFGPAFLVNPVTEHMYYQPTFIGEVIPSGQLFTRDGVQGGLTAEFFKGINFDERVAKRVDESIDFDWNDGSRPDAVPQHYYSIRWTGKIQTQESGEYEFFTTSNDGIRLWIDEKLVIDNWTDHGAQIDVGNIKLKGHTQYSIKLEYYQTLGGAVTKLAWNHSGVQKPVVKVPPTKTRPVYLPETTKWFDFWSGTTLNGGQTIDALTPIDIMPLYVKAGSILPMGPNIQYSTEKATDPIELRVYCGADATFNLYEDENDNYNYEKGVYATIPFRWDEQKQTLVIGERKGDFPGMLKKRTFHIVWVREGYGTGIETTEKPDRIVTYSGKEISIMH